jgi:RecB family exonuclease
LARHLLAGAPSGAFLDLTQTIVIVPASRAQTALARHLQELAGRPVLLPTILTPGRSLAQLIVPDRTAASDAATTLACFHALTDLTTHVPDALAPVLGSAPAEPNLLALAARISQVAQELSRAGLTIAVLRDRGASGEFGEFFPSPIWSALATVMDRALAELSQHGLDLPHAIAARAIDRGQLATTGVARVVVLLADPDPMERRLLAALAARGIAVEVVVHDSNLPDLEDGFPSHAAWSAARPPISLERIVRVEGLDDQPVAVLQALDSFEQPVPAESVAIAALGPTDPAIVSRTLSPAGIPIALPPTRTADQGSAALLLRAISAWVGEPTAFNLGTLVRHPWIERQLHELGLHAALRQLTLYIVATGVRRLDEPLVELPKPSSNGSVEPVLAAMRELLATITAASTGRERLLALHTVLTRLQPSLAPMGDAAASVALARAVLTLAELPESLLARCSLGQLIDLIVNAARGVDVPSAERTGIECMGWLEAGVCDAPHVVVLSANDGVLPEAAAVDPWLPDSLRQSLRLPCARARRARDAWILDGLLKRKASVWFGVPATNGDGEPLRPSRFLIGSADQAARTLALTGDDGRSTLASWPLEPQTVSVLPTHPVVPELPPITRMSVTQFATYIRCPYEYLRTRVLKAERRDDLQLELDAMAFGNLVHAALQEWGKLEQSRSAPTTDPKVIASELNAALDGVLKARLPASVHGTVVVQVRMARERLAAFAREQAKWAQQGWAIKHVELAFDAPRAGHQIVDAAARVHGALPDEGESIDDDGAPLPDSRQHPAPMFPNQDGLYLSGRIDRVDQNLSTGQWAALDYKTSSEPPDPKKHLAKAGWIDLQLPLYRELLATIGIPRDTLQLGLIALPAQPDLARIQLAGWSQDQLDEAVVAAAGIVAEVKAARSPADFVPSGKPPLGDDPLVQAMHGVGIRGLAPNAPPNAVPATHAATIGGAA